MSLEDDGSSQEVGASPEQPVEVSTPSTGNAESSEMSKLLADAETIAGAPLVPGEVVQGEVIKVADGEVVISLGLKTEATLPVSEFQNNEGQVNVAPGDRVDIWIEQYDEETGRVEISHQKAARRRIWENIEKAFQDQTNITGKVIDRIKGGLTVDVGVPAFLPASHADVRAHGNVDELKGQEITCKIIKINRKRNNVVISRKLALEEELNRRKAELVGAAGGRRRGGGHGQEPGGLWRLRRSGRNRRTLAHHRTLPGGAFRTPRKWSRSGQEIRVKVLKHDVEKGRISLGLKQLTPDPWEMVPRTYHAGDHVYRAGGEPGGLWGFRGTRARRGGAHPHFGNELEQAPAPSLQDPQGR